MIDVFKMSYQWTNFLFGNVALLIKFQYLYGVVCENITEKLAGKIVNEPWDFDFPYTLDEYNNLEC